MSILPIRAGDCPEVPWKNGGGTTREIAVFPPGAGMDDFVWRLSMATVAVAGPFSSFAGCDRTLAVIDGTLALSGPGVAVTLDAGAPPFRFDGAAPVHGEPVDGPVRDLNAMVRRGACDVVMVRGAAGDHVRCDGTAFVVALEPQLLDGVSLDRLDCARVLSPIPLGGAAICVDFRMRA